jgi:hypothetical protein
MNKSHTETTAGIREQARSLITKNLSVEQFAGELFQYAQTSDGSFSAILWRYSSERQLHISVEFRLREVMGSDSPTIVEGHRQIVQECFASGVPLMQGIAYEPLPERSHVSKILPILDDKKPIGVLEVIHANDKGEYFNALALEFATAISVYFSQVNLPSRQPVIRERTEFWSHYDRFLALLYGTLRVKDVAAVAATDARSVIGCERVCVLIYFGRRSKVMAISHVESIQRRGQLMRLLKNLGDQAFLANKTMTFEGESIDELDEFSVALADYVEESRIKAISLVPLYGHQQRRRFSDTVSDLKSRKVQPTGLLVLEQFTKSSFDEGAKIRAELVCEHIGAALQNAKTYESVFLLPVWQAIGDFRSWFRGKRAVSAVVIMLVFIAIITAAVITPWTYRVTVDGIALPEIQHEVFAPYDGTVVKVLVESGDRVEADSPLLILENDELQSELVVVENGVREHEELAKSFEVQIEATRDLESSEQNLSLQSQLASNHVELVGLRTRATLLRRQVDGLTVRATHDGVVATFQLEQQLLNRPVARGELLLEVMNDAGPWRLELEIPEYRMGHILDAYNKNPRLPVTYITLSDVDQKHEAVLSAVGSRSNQTDDSETIVEAFAQINRDDLSHRRIGTEVTAKIECGQRSLLYCMVGDLVDFVRRHVWW